MTITVKRSGGFVGNTRVARLSTESLPPDVAERIEKAAAQLAPSAASPMPPGSADFFVYDITIDDGHEQRTLHFEGDPNPASALIRDILSAAT
jgi:hypothetical protein